MKYNGFIALFTVILISGVLLALMATSGMVAFFSRFDVVESQQYAVAQSLALGCQQLALLNFAQNYTYDPATDPAYVAGKGAKESIGSGTCYVKSVTLISSGATSKTILINTWAQTGASYASLNTVTQVFTSAAPSVLIMMF